MIVSFATDETYAQHAAAAMHSLLKVHPGTAIRIVLLLPTAPGPKVQSVIHLASGLGAMVEALEIPPQWLQRVSHHPQFGLHAWLRLILPEILQNADRVLYLDSDLVVLDRLNALWECPLGDQLVGAVRNPLYPHQSPRRLRGLGLGSADEYFNSGVLLMNLAGMRRENCAEALVAYAEQHQNDLIYPDQDVLNAVLKGRWMELPLRYNAQSPIFELPASRLPFRADEIKSATNHPAIVHFSGMLKPWLDACGHPWRSAYWTALQGTPWADAQPQHPRWYNTPLRKLPYSWKQWIWRVFPQSELRRPPPVASHVTDPR